MAIKYEKIKAGDELYDYHSERAGHTTMRRWSNWPVRIIELNANGAIVSWNGNRPQQYYRRDLERLRRKPGKERDPWRTTP